jgi:hypothetical protein
MCTGPNAATVARSSATSSMAPCKGVPQVATTSAPAPRRIRTCSRRSSGSIVPSPSARMRTVFIPSSSLARTTS